MIKLFWKLIGKDNKSIGWYGKIHYIVGETIEVLNADPNKAKQCAAGIHCFAFTDQEYEYHNVLLGPKVAILEVEEKPFTSLHHIFEMTLEAKDAYGEIDDTAIVDLEKDIFLILFKF